jgi:hypothetical protein
VTFDSLSAAPGVEAGSTAFIDLPSGRSVGLGGDVADILPFVLDAQNFARLDANERRKFLFGLMGVKMDSESIIARMLEKGLDEAKTKRIAPYLRAGFEAAQKEAAGHARDAKAAWKTITGGETWGKEKSEKWQPKHLLGGEEKAGALAENAKDKQKEIRAEIDQANQDLGAARNIAAQRKGFEQEYERLAEQAGKLDRIKKKLAIDEGELKQWETKVKALKDSASSQDALKCPECGAMLVEKNIGLGFVLVRAGPLAKGTDDDLKNLAEYEKSLALMQNSVANDKRDLHAALHAAERLKEIEKAQAEEHKVDLDALQNRVSCNGWTFHKNKSGEPIVGRLYARLKLSGITPAVLVSGNTWSPDFSGIQ